MGLRDMIHDSCSTVCSKFLSSQTDGGGVGDDDTNDHLDLCESLFQAITAELLLASHTDGEIYGRKKFLPQGERGFDIDDMVKRAADITFGKRNGLRGPTELDSAASFVSSAADAARSFNTTTGLVQVEKRLKEKAAKSSPQNKDNGSQSQEGKGAAPPAGGAGGGKLALRMSERFEAAAPSLSSSLHPTLAQTSAGTATAGGAILKFPQPGTASEAQRSSSSQESATSAAKKVRSSGYGGGSNKATTGQRPSRSPPSQREEVKDGGQLGGQLGGQHGRQHGGGGSPPLARMGGTGRNPAVSSRRNLNNSSESPLGRVPPSVRNPSQTTSVRSSGAASASSASLRPPATGPEQRLSDEPNRRSQQQGQGTQRGVSEARGVHQRTGGY
jgi:hypothetical protein